MPLRLGIIGTGSMANSHATHYAAAKGVELTACCDIVTERAAEFADRFGIKRYYTNYQEMLDNEQLDGVSVVTVDALHAKASTAALARGVGVLCEKPLAATVKEAEAMAAAARASGRPAMVNFSKRNSSALQQAHRLIEYGKIGRIMHVEASYLQSWLVDDYWGDWRADHRWLWRLSVNHGSMGVLGDLGCHIFDMAQFLCGDFNDVYCILKTFEKGAPGIPGNYDLKANDSFSATVSFASGAVGSIHSSRWATGHKNREYICVYGEKGAIKVDFEVSDSILFLHGKDADGEWVKNECKPTPTNYARFLKSLKSGVHDASDFEQGLKIQRYMAACFASSRTGKKVNLADPQAASRARVPLTV